MSFNMLTTIADACFSTSVVSLTRVANCILSVNCWCDDHVKLTAHTSVVSLSPETSRRGLNTEIFCCSLKKCLTNFPVGPRSLCNGRKPNRKNEQTTKFCFLKEATTQTIRFDTAQHLQKEQHEKYSRCPSKNLGFALAIDVFNNLTYIYKFMMGSSNIVQQNKSN